MTQQFLIPGAPAIFCRPAGQIYTDQTGRFPVVSSKGNKYIMILYDYDSNAILAQPIIDRTAPELLRAFQVMEQELVARGLKPKYETGQ
jgi:hypothetical protein